MPTTLIILPPHIRSHAQYNVRCSFGLRGAVQVLPQLYKTPIVDVGLVREWTDFTRAGAQNVINRFVEMGVLHDRNPKKTWDKTYIYKEYVAIFSD